MTKREAAIISAYTGYLIGDIDDLYVYLKEKVGRCVYTHELSGVLKEYREEFKKDLVLIEVME